MNVFLLVLGMLMEGFSAILVAVPLILPFVADLGMRHPDEKTSPFHLAMIFLLNLEIAYCCPPLGLNLFISSFRFNRPVVEPLPGRPAVRRHPRRGARPRELRAVDQRRGGRRRHRGGARQGGEGGLPPRDAWMMECVQEDPTNPQPCSASDRERFPGGQAVAPPEAAEAGAPSTAPAPDAGCDPDFEDCPRH